MDIYGKVSQGVRFDHLADIEAFYKKAERKAMIAMKNRFKSIDVIMLREDTNEVKLYLQKKGIRPAWKPEINSPSKD